MTEEFDRTKKEQCRAFWQNEPDFLNPFCVRTEAAPG
jgi:hypothetical protein